MNRPVSNLGEALNRLAGQALTSITFIMDYLQITFDGGRITVVSEPSLFDRDTSFFWDSPGFSNALRTQIGIQLKVAEVDEKRVIFRFENGRYLSIPLAAEPERPEHLIFEDETGKTWVA